MIESFNLFYAVGVPKDDEKAKELFFETYSKGNKFADGFAYFQGWGKKKNLQKSLELFLQTLDEVKHTFEKKKEKSYSLFMIGFIYHLGEKGRVERDILKAIEYYEKAMKLDHPTAINNLAYIYQYGEKGIIEMDIFKAIQL